VIPGNEEPNPEVKSAIVKVVVPEPVTSDLIMQVVNNFRNDEHNF